MLHGQKFRDRPVAELGVICESGQMPAHSYLVARYTDVIYLLTHVNAVYSAQA